MGCVPPKAAIARNPALIQSSPLLQLRMEYPTQAVFQIRSLDTVQTLLDLVAVELGLEQQDTAGLALEVAGDFVGDPKQTLQAAGLHQNAEFVVLGEVEEMKAHRVDILEASKHARVQDVRLVCRRCPQHVHARSEPERYTALHLAAIRHSTAEVALMLLKAGADPSVRDKGNYTPLHKAAIYNSIEVARLLIEANADPSARNSINQHRESPLHFAAIHSSMEVVSLLLDSKANPNPKDIGGKTPLDYASKSNSSVAMLIEQAGGHLSFQPALTRQATATIRPENPNNDRQMRYPHSQGSSGVGVPASEDRDWFDPKMIPN
eukprot:TRINITY_DN15596_c0_g1_i5.p1 TRINITY_DN15596_c0_g1~~TRINITY_DN15596_c0_g1_i5.p1  ORF type:complete len:321 (+),score=58.09 TRINITY_DN15596_c0_g1_i5:162-1124(+)